VRDIETIDSEFRLLLSIRRMVREAEGLRASGQLSSPANAADLPKDCPRPVALSCVS
jgi:hypothetical protein